MNHQPESPAPTDSPEPFGQAVSEGFEDSFVPDMASSSMDAFLQRLAHEQEAADALTQSEVVQAAAQQAVAQQAAVQQAQVSQQSSSNILTDVASAGGDIGINAAIEGVAMAVRSSASMVPEVGVDGFQTGGGVGGEAFQAAAVEAAESGAFEAIGEVAGSVVEGTIEVVAGVIGGILG